MEARIWKSFLIGGTLNLSAADVDFVMDSVDVEYTRKDDPFSGYIPDKRAMSAKMVIAFPTANNISSEVDLLVSGWLNNAAVVPFPTPAQIAWIRWLLLSSDVGRSRNTLRLLYRLFRNERIEWSSTVRLILEQLSYLNRSSFSSRVGEVSETTEEALRRYVEYSQLIERQFNSKVNRFRMLYRVRLDPEMYPVVMVDRDTQIESRVIPGIRKRRAVMTPLDLEEEQRVIGEWDEAKRLEESIKNDPFLKELLKPSDMQYAAPMYIQRLKDSVRTSAFGPDELESLAKKRRRDEFYFDPLENIKPSEAPQSTEARSVRRFGKQTAFLF